VTLQHGNVSLFRNVGKELPQMST